MNEREIFTQATRLTDPAEQAAYLGKACGTDESLRQRLVDLLSAHARAQSFLEVPPSAIAVESSSTTAQPSLERPGTLIGPYKLLQVIGEGGMGVVYMAEQTEPVERRVALKIIKPGMDSRQVIGRFEAERQALAMMDHPNVAKVLDAGTTDGGRPYFVMEMIKGVPITKYCDEKHFSLRARLELMIPVCQAIQHAHQKGIIHRDIKPTNVLIAQYDGRPVPKVIDFGVAKATAQKLTERTMFTELGQIVGTLEYMSPEQAELNQLDIDTRSDIYSLGVLLYELLTGSTPFDKKKLRSAAFAEMLRIIREDEPPKPSTKLSTIDTLPSVAANRQTEPARLSKALKGELDWIVMKALEKDRNRRYETANGLAADMQRYLSNEPVQACPPSTTYRLQKYVLRNRATLTTVGVIIFALVICSVVSIWQAVRAIAAEAQASANEVKAKSEEHRALTAVAAERVVNATLAAKQHELRQNLYRAETDLAYQGLLAGHIARAIELLERHRPESGEMDLRGFEWDHLWQRCHDETWRWSDVDQAIRNFAFSRDGSRIALFCGNPDGRDAGTLVRMVDAKTGTLRSKLTPPTRSIGDFVFAGGNRFLVFRTRDGIGFVDAVSGKATGQVPCPGIKRFGNPLASSPTEPLVAFTADSETIKLVDIESMRVLRSWAGKEISRLQFSPDGSLVAGAGVFDQVMLWDPKTGEVIREIRTPSELINIKGVSEVPQATKGTLRTPIGLGPDLLAFSPDGTVLAFAKAKAIQFWDLQNNSLRSLELKLDKATFSTLNYVPDENLIATACSDGLIRIWDATNGKLQRQFPAPTQMLSYSPDASLVACASRTELVVFPRDLNSYHSVRVSTDSQTRSVTLASASQADLLVTSHSNDPLVIWRASTGESLEKITWEQQAAGTVATDKVAISPDGQMIACVALRGTRIVVLAGDSFSDRVTLEAGSGQFYCATISPDKQLLAIGGFAPVGKQVDNLCLWDTKTLSQVKVLKGHPRTAWTPTGKAMILEGSASIHAIAFSPDGKVLASGGGDNNIRLWDVSSGELLRELSGHLGGGYGVHCVAFSRDGKLLASVLPTDRNVKLWDVQTGQLIASLVGHTSGVTRIAFAPDGKTLASGGTEVRLWNIPTREPIAVLDDAQDTITSLAFSNDGKTLVAGSAGKLHFWRAANRDSLLLDTSKTESRPTPRTLSQRGNED